MALTLTAAERTELERRVRHLHPTVIALFVKPQSSGGFKDAVGRRYGNTDK